MHVSCHCQNKINNTTAQASKSFLVIKRGCLKIVCCEFYFSLCMCFLIYMLSSSINEVCIFNIKYVKKFTLMRPGMLSDMQHVQLHYMNTVFRFRTHNLAPHNSVKWIGLISCCEELNQIVITCYGIVEIFGCFFIITVIFCTMLRCKIKNILSI